MIASWLERCGHRITFSRMYGRIPASFPHDAEFLVIMGGPMGVNDEDRFPWLPDEKRYIREAVRDGKNILGVCLGAQLIASALGSRVYPNPVKEIGWYPVFAVSNNSHPGIRFPESIDVFHWHGDTFDLPDGAIHLAQSETCVNQAFQVGETVLGLQFHPEATPQSVSELVAHCRDELIPSATIASEEDILAVPADKYVAANAFMEDILSSLTKNFA